MFDAMVVIDDVPIMLIGDGQFFESD